MVVFDARINSSYGQSYPNAASFVAPLATFGTSGTFGVGLSSGSVVKGAGSSGVIGVATLSADWTAGSSVRVVTNGEMPRVGAVAGVADGGPVYAQSDGTLTATASGNTRVGWRNGTSLMVNV
ncbi:MAG TPA: hypothetical protein VFU43_18665 [Streptosporangiaceae bacterium]|nr:hypothetical protein [Streptosporangiaceae bacterium]